MAHNKSPVLGEGAAGDSNTSILGDDLTREQAEKIIATYRSQFDARLFPCQKGTKRPLQKGWQDSSYSASELVDFILDGHPIGWALGPHDLVIDVDAPSEQHADSKGLESFERLKNQFPKLLSELEMAVVDTPTGGCHIYLTTEQPARLRANSHEVPGIDIKQTGGYVIIAGSEHPEGGRYRFNFVTELNGFRRQIISPRLLEIFRKPNPQEPSKPQTDGLCDKYYSPEQLKRLLFCIDLATHGNRETWIKILFAFKSAGGHFNDFLEWCRTDPRYRQQWPVQKEWNSANSEGVTVGTLLHYADQCDSKTTGQIKAELHSFIDLDEEFDIETTGDSKVSFNGCTYTYNEFVDSFPERRPILIGDLLREGETCNIIAASKEGKSWFAISLAMTVATGGKLLGNFKTEESKVLYVDNELHAQTMASRLRLVTETLAVDRSKLESNLQVASLRGMDLSIDALSKVLDAVKGRGIKLVILDAFYRFIPAEGINQMAG